MELLNIKRYKDYRSYLKVYFELKQKSNPHWSYGVWAKRLDLKSTSSLTKIIHGERDPGDEITEKLVKYFNFGQEESDYFNDLVRLSKIADVRLKAMLMEKMGREYKDSKLLELSDKSFEIISHWFCLTIREMVLLKDFESDPAWIKKRLLFDVPLEDIQTAIENLLHQGLLKRTDSGKLVQSDGHIHTSNDIASIAIKKYHEQMLGNATKALWNVDISSREISSETMSINKSKLPEAKELIRDFKKNFSRLIEEKDGEEVYQLQVQFFPLTEQKLLH